MATPVGLTRYDGSFIREWNRQNGLRCNGLRCVAIDAAQTIWIGSDIGLECISADGHAEPTLDSAIWRFGLCQHIAFCPDGAWVGTAHGLVKLERRDDKNGYRIAFVADVGFVNDVVFINDNRILAASAKEGLIETDGRTWWRYRSAALRDCRITRVSLAPDGALLVGTDDGLFVIDDRSNAVLAHMVAPYYGGAHFDPTVTAVSADKGHYWVAFGRVLMAYKASIEGEEINEHLIVESVVNDVLLDALGNAFIATNSSGLAKVSCLRNAVKRIDLGILGGVYCIKPTAENAHTIGGELLFGAVEISDDGSAVALGWPNGVPDTVVWDSLPDAEGMWLATQAGLFFGPHGNDNVPVVFRQMFDTDATLAAPNRVLMQRGAELWAGSLRGLARIHNGWCTPVTADGASLGYVYAMHVDADSALWVCTLGRGLWREKNGLHYVGNKLLSPDGNTYAVASDASGRMIILQDEKVVLLAPDLSARLVTKLPPVAGWTVAWINSTTVAIGASDGLRIIDVDTGDVLRHIQSLFRLRDWEFTNNRTLVADQQGRLLCGLNGGLVRVDVAALAKFEPPVCKLLDIVWTGESPRQKDGIFLPNRGNWSVRVRVFCAWFVESSRLRYQFQLIGFDND